MIVVLMRSFVRKNILFGYTGLFDGRKRGRILLIESEPGLSQLIPFEDLRQTI